jgi:DNA primase
MSGNLASLNFNAVHARPSLEGIADLKAKVDIVDIVRRYVMLKAKGHEFWGLCPFHGEKTPSFKADRKRQRFKCFGCNAGGDALDFLRAIEGLDSVGTIKRLRELAGDRAAPVVRRTPPQADAPDPEAERNRQRAQEIWYGATSIPHNGIAYDYLVERRGITYWHPQRLLWHPSCPWSGAPGGRARCIVAPINDCVTDRTVGVWRILPVLTGKVERRGLGPMSGNACRLFPAEGPQIVIAEGVEDALAAAELTGLPAWAALSAGNMAELVLPARLREVLILADADDAGRRGAHALTKRLREEGRQARVLRPRATKDANDALLARRAG